LSTPEFGNPLAFAVSLHFPNKKGLSLVRKTVFHRVSFTVKLLLAVLVFVLVMVVVWLYFEWRLRLLK
jgi:hypothetical protein